MNDSFTDTVEGTLRGKYVRAHGDVGVFEGWVDRIDPDCGSLLLHDARNATSEESIGGVYLQTCEAVEVLRPAKRIEFCAIADLEPYPDYDPDTHPAPELVRLAYRNRFPGEFPVVRESGTILAGHEYVAAAEIAGLEHIPVEMIAVSDNQAAELFRLAQSDEEASADPDDSDGSEQTTDDGSGSDEEGSSSVYGY